MFDDAEQRDGPDHHDRIAQRQLLRERIGGVALARTNAYQRRQCSEAAGDHEPMQAGQCEVRAIGGPVTRPVVVQFRQDTEKQVHRRRNRGEDDSVQPVRIRDGTLEAVAMFRRQWRVDAVAQAGPERGEGELHKKLKEEESAVASTLRRVDRPTR